PDGIERAAAVDASVGRDAGLAERSKRPVEPPAGRRAPRVLVDDVPGSRIAHRCDRDDPDRSSRGTALDGFDQLAAPHPLTAAPPPSARALPRARGGPTRGGARAAGPPTPHAPPAPGGSR